ncbi:hypothetical protein HYX13_04820, partial [Candidatus Woesearchaeota archaeon]|nr:hypothetical protein [Candidatus Woesearchaeota archaeon]
TLHDGFELRAWECQKCSSVIYHPSDLRDYEDYKKLRKQNFNVKLRLVGNSFCVSIPKEIIDFQNEMLNELEQEQRQMERKITQLVRLNLEEPGKIGLFFFQKSEDEEDEEEFDDDKEDEE